MYRPNRPKWLFSAVVLAALIVSVLPPVSPARAQDPNVMPEPVQAPAALLQGTLACPDGQFLAQYYSGNAQDFSGSLLLEQCEEAPLSYNGSRKPKEINVTPWSARFTGKFGFDAATYRFLMRVDDGLKLYIDDLTTPAVIRWTYTTAAAYDPQVYDRAMTAGIHTIRVEYHEDGGNWRLFAGWLPTMGASDACPLNNLRADYWKNTTRVGAALFSRCEDAPIHYVWGSSAGLFGLRPGNLSAHWNGTVDGSATSIMFPPVTTRYTGQASGRMVAVVDGATVFANVTTADGEQRYDTPTAVSAVDHTIDVIYENAAAPATVHFGWAKAPSACGVPLATTVGADNEILIANGHNDASTTSMRLGIDYSWVLKGPLVGAAADALALSPDTTVFASADSNGSLTYRLVDATGQATQMIRPLTLTIAGPPSLVSLSPLNWLVFARPVTETTRIFYKESYAGAVSNHWRKIPGVDSAASDLAVVASGMDHIYVFYTDSAKAAWMTERINGTWRKQPVPLGGRFDSALAAAAPNPNYIAVFGVGENNQAYYKAWTPAKSDDWSDVGGFVSLGTWQCQKEPIAVVAPDVNHITAACRGSSNVGAWQWKAATGWGAVTTAYASAAGGPLTLVAPEQKKLWLLWADHLNLYRLEASEGVWNASPTIRSVGWPYSPRRVVAVVPQEGRVHHFVRTGASSYYDFVWAPTGTNGTTSGTAHWGTINNNTLMKVGGKAFLVPFYQGELNVWRIGKPIDPWTMTTFTTAEEPYAVTSLSPSAGAYAWANQAAASAAGDVDADGDDELLIFVTGGVGNGSTARLYSVEYGLSGGVPVRTGSHDITVSAPSTSFNGSLAIAIGDLDGDGRRNEIVLTAQMSSNTTYMWVYQYSEGASPSVALVYGLDLGYIGPPPPPGQSAATGYPAIELAAGKVRGARGVPGDQVVLAAAQCANSASCTYRLYAVSIHSFRKNTDGEWEHETVVTLANSLSVTASVPDGARLSTAMALGDIDADGLKEIVYSLADRLLVLPGDVTTGTYHDGRGNEIPTYPGILKLTNGLYPSMVIPTALYYRSMAAGDVDKDGKAEVVLTAGPQNGGNTSYVMIYQWLQPPEGTSNRPGLRLMSSEVTSGQVRVPLIGDLDNDSWMAELAGCREFSDTRVMAVVNAPPRWVGWTDSGGVLHPTEPIQRGSGNFGQSTTYGDSYMTGTSFTIGASVTVGFEQEWEVFGQQIGSTKFEVENEFATSFGRSTERGTSITSNEDVGWSDTNIVDHDVEDYARGIVAFNTTRYGCYSYDTYSLEDPTLRDRIMMCAPMGDPFDDFVTVQDWNNQRLEYGPNWFYVGHDTNDLRSYPEAIPSGANVLWRMERSRLVSRSGTSGLDYGWGSDRAQDGAQTTSRSWENTTKVTSGGDLFGVTFEGSISFGIGGESSHTTSYEFSLSMGGTIEKWPASCTTCSNYTALPYIAGMKARTQSGIEYEYLMADYVVPCIGNNCIPEALDQEGAAQPDVPVPQGPLPAAPVVTSPTHPDPNTWYTGRDVTLNWQQPAGDPATVAGYSWTLNAIPDSTPGTAPVAVNTVAYSGEPDGVHYLHIAASAGFGADSPVAHYPVRIDGTAPVVTIVLDPPSPNMNGWFKTPVTARIEVDDGSGSGAALVEYSTDGSSWQPYTGPLDFATESAGFTLSTRATDHAGHVSEIAQREIKIDTTPPSTVDLDSYGLSYARIDQDESGNNVQLILGGALNDNLSGRSQVELSAGENAGWRAVDAVGVFPMPPGNTFPPGQATTLNWIYTPTFEIRGVYNLYGHGVDLAGNVETGWGSSPIGTLFWPPDGNPKLSDSRLTASPTKANVGDTVHYTLGLRNSGVQEAAVKVTAGVPAGLTVLEDTIGNGQYDAATRQVTWQLHALWPNQPQYLSFAATVDPGSSGEVTTQADLMAYWPGYENDPSKVFHHMLTNAITVGAAPPEAPKILHTRISEGPVVGDRQVTLDVGASEGAQFLYVKEWTLDPATGAWTQVASSGWLPIIEGDGMTLIADGSGKRLRYNLTLAESEGVHYLGIWVGDANQQPSSLNEGGLLFTNLLGTPTTLAAGQRTQYRLPFTEAALAILTLATTAGDADLNVWEPRDGFKPVHWSNAAGAPPATDTVAFYAPENGDYLVEVQAVTDSAFVLALSGTLKPAGPEQEVPAQETLPASVHKADKQRPDHPASLSTPFSLPGADVPGETVPLMPLKLYLPLAGNGAITSGPAAPVVPDAYPARERRP